MSAVALRAAGLNKTWGGFVANRDVSLELAVGERHALIGPNGAGKTTFINLLTGVLAPTAGEVFIGEENVTRLAQHERVSRGMTRTYQITSLFPGLTPLESVVLAILERDGLATHWWKPVATYREAAREARDLLERLHLGAEADQPTKSLAYGKQRLVEIALALATKPKILLLDEPAAGIPAAQSAEVFEVIAGLPRDVTILFIEHDMQIVFRFAERVSVLVAGAVLTQGTPAEVANDARVKRVYLGKAVMAERLSLERVSAGYGESVILDGAELVLQAGESLALLGRNGAGKSTLLRTVMGLTRLHAGCVRHDGRDLKRDAPWKRSRAGIAWVPQERGMFPSLTVDEHLTTVARPGPCTIARAYDLFPSLASRRTSPGSRLSGGEQQMLAIARALVMNPTVLLLDEPMEGLAPVIVQELKALLATLIGQGGMTVVLVEQHARLALSITGRAAVLERGRIVHDAPSEQLLADTATLQRLVAVA